MAFFMLDYLCIVLTQIENTGGAVMTPQEMEDMLTYESVLRIYTQRVGRFVEASVCMLHWPAAPDAFLVEVIEHTAESGIFYWIQRSDPSLIIEPT